MIGIGVGLLGYVAHWIAGLLQTAKAAADAGQRAAAGPMLVWVMAIVPAAMVLIVAGIVMRTKSRSA